MNFKHLFLIITTLFFIGMVSLLPSCAKEGPQGIPGPAGDSGVAGPAGLDGSVIYSGTGVPSGTLGKNGDYYLDRGTGNLYGPKTANGWGTPLALGGGSGQGSAGPQGPTGPQGPAGAAGKAGSQIFSGSGTPATTLGSVGDFYLDVTNLFLYGPKSAGGWGTPVLLRGAQGPQGPAGPAGVAGSQIFAGNGAPAANLGTAGDYYLDKATGNFYGPKTTTGWGSPIALGGGAGSQGPAGPQGPAGAAGAAGAAGSQIFSGSGAPPAATGKTGDYFIDDTHAVIYGPKTAAGWPATGLALGVNNIITYDFVDKVTPGLPYKWIGAHDGPTVFKGFSYIWLPYNNAAAQTTGFTIPQAIIDNGIVMSYIRYFSGPPSDTATAAGMTPWWQMPYSLTYEDQLAFGVDANAYVNINILSTGFGILLNQQNDGNNIDNFAEGFMETYVPAVIRIVLIPSGQTNTITGNPAAMMQLKPDKVFH